MVQSRKSLLEKAIVKAIGSPRALSIEVQNIYKAKQDLIHDNNLKNNNLDSQNKVNQPNNGPHQIITRNENSLAEKKEMANQNDGINKNELEKDKKAEERQNKDKDAEKLADFFNGKVLDIEI